MIKTYKFNSQGFAQAKEDRQREETYKMIVKHAAVLSIMGTLFVTTQVLTVLTIPAFVPDATLFEPVSKAFTTLVKISGV